jgi:hypothetical protein
MDLNQGTWFQENEKILIYDLIKEFQYLHFPLKTTRVDLYSLSN